MLDIVIDEIWVPIKIKELEDYYEISSCGRIRNKYTNKILKQSIDKQGYSHISLARKKKKPLRYKQFSVHRLVAIHFIPNPNPEVLTTVNHKDFNKSNNCVDNLEWMSMEDNIHHAAINGKYKAKLGEENPTSKYKSKDIEIVCQMLEDGYSNKHIFKVTGVPTNEIGGVKRREIWKHISYKYNFEGPKEKAKYKDWFPVFDALAIEGRPWSYVKAKYNIHGKKTKAFRALYKRRCEKILKRSTTIQMEP